MATRKTDVIGRLTEGERYVAMYLEDLNVHFEPQHRINLNRGQGKGYRIIDFYLPEFDVLLEYNGQWDVNEWHRNRYRQKRKELLDNGLTLVEIYPNQLGIIEYSFPVKMIQTLSEGNLATGYLRAFKWKLMKNDDQWPDTSDYIILALLNALVLFDLSFWVYSIPFTAIIMGLKTYRLRNRWKELEEFECQASENLNQAPNYGIIEECLNLFKAHGLHSSEHQLMQFLKGQNASYFTELLEARGYGFFQHLSNQDVLEIIRETREEQIEPAGFKRGKSEAELDDLNLIRARIKRTPLTKLDVDDVIKGYREKFRRSHEPWEDWEVGLLHQAYAHTKSTRVLADVFERSEGAIQSRLAKLD